MKQPKTRSSSDVLKYSPKPASQATVRRHYLRWRLQQGLPARCDMSSCMFHTQPLLWEGKCLPLILDHVSGNKLDNSPTNLRFLCPNCDSQLLTRGGANRGRILEAEEGKFVLLSRDGKRHYHLIAETGHLTLTGYPPTVVIGPANEKL